MGILLWRLCRSVSWEQPGTSRQRRPILRKENLELTSCSPRSSVVVHVAFNIVFEQEYYKIRVERNGSSYEMDPVFERNTIATYRQTLPSVCAYTVVFVPLDDSPVPS